MLKIYKMFTSFIQKILALEIFFVESVADRTFAILSSPNYNYRVVLLIKATSSFKDSDDSGNTQPDSLVCLISLVTFRFLLPGMFYGGNSDGINFNATC